MTSWWWGGFALDGVGLEELGEFGEARGCDLVEKTGELVLPLETVSEDGVLERAAVEKNELDAQDSLLRLHVVRHFRVSACVHTI